MKKLFILLLLAISATANAVEVSENDTLTILKPKKVRIITGDSIQKIKVYGREGEDKYTYESKILLVDSNYVSEQSINKETWSFDFVKSKSHGTGYPLKQKNLSSRLGFGLCYGANADYKGPQSVGSSWEIMWTIAEIEKYGYGKHNGFSIGFGINWRNFRMDGRSKFVKLDDGTITEEALPAGYDNDFSRIKVFSLTIPVMWKYRTKQVTFGLGPVFNINTYASIKNRYWDADGEKHKQMFKKIHQRPITVDIMAELSFHNWFSIYGKFSPMTILNSTYANDVNFQPVSFGIYF
ncbi:MAG: hypothetical protein E7102_12690 [Prevotella ruminicola]|jgi:hypothetical protein|uniref:Outer membrane protein beta-barrel domain-containing protein n=1 Tax=Xylanibacter ruminicola TaxID=839 RepID=A0A928BU01_XYLRU|nr:hypothetical protein [Xylanibacter ruminicola]